MESEEELRNEIKRLKSYIEWCTSERKRILNARKKGQIRKNKRKEELKLLIDERKKAART